MPDISSYVAAQVSAVPDGATHASAHSAKWDPNHAVTSDSSRSLGLLLGEGVFQYVQAGSGLRTTVVLHARAHLAGGQAITRQQPPHAALQQVKTPWATWDFVSGQPCRVIFGHQHSNQLLSCTLPLDSASSNNQQAGDACLGSIPAARETPVYLLHHFRNQGALTVLRVNSSGDLAAAGFRDGTVAFIPLLAPPLGADALSEPVCTLPTVVADAHGVPVTAIAMLSGRLNDANVQTSLCASGAADQSIIIFDLQAKTRLCSLLTPLAAPVSALLLRLVPPHCPGCLPHDPGSPSVIIAAGDSDGGLQIWSLSAARDPELRACWTNEQESPVLALSFAQDGTSLVSVSQGSMPASRLAASETTELAACLPPWGNEHARPRAHTPGAHAAHEVEVHATEDWRLLARHQLRVAASPIVSADFHTTSGNAALPKLLVCRASGTLQQSDLDHLLGADDGDRATGPGRRRSFVESSVPPSSQDDLVHLPTGSSSNPESGNSAGSADDLRHGSRRGTSTSVEQTERCCRAEGGTSAGPECVSGDCEGRYVECGRHSPAQVRREQGACGSAVRPQRLSRATKLPAFEFSDEAQVRQRRGNGSSQQNARRQVVHADSTSQTQPTHPAQSARPPPPSAPPPLCVQLDAPARVSAMLHAARCDETPSSRLARPSACSSTLVERQLAQQQAVAAAAARAKDAERRRRVASRKGAAALNTPQETTERYRDLTPVDAVAEKPAQRPVQRRHEPRWLATRDIEPCLKDLYTPDREPQVLDTEPIGHARQRNGAVREYACDETDAPANKYAGYNAKGHATDGVNESIEDYSQGYVDGYEKHNKEDCASGVYGTTHFQIDKSQLLCTSPLAPMEAPIWPGRPPRGSVIRLADVRALCA